MSETLELGGLTFEVRRSARRKTLGLTVDRGGELVVHAPEETSREQLTSWVNKKLLWVHRKLALKEEAAPRVRAPEYVSGETFCYLGRRHRLKLVAHQAQPLSLMGGMFHLRKDVIGGAADLFQQWYVRNGGGWIGRRIDQLTRKVGERPTRIAVRDLGYRWGSCGRDGSVYFNWRLLQLPVRLADYVIVHELVHLREGHHGPDFWAGLSRIMPDWEQRKEALASCAKDYLVFGLPA